MYQKSYVILASYLPFMVGYVGYFLIPETETFMSWLLDLHWNGELTDEYRFKMNELESESIQATGIQIHSIHSIKNKRYE